MTEELTIPRPGYRLIEVEIAEDDYQNYLQASEQAGYTSFSSFLAESMKNYKFQIKLSYSGKSLLVGDPLTETAAIYTTDGLAYAFKQGEDARRESSPERKRRSFQTVNGGKA